MTWMASFINIQRIIFLCLCFFSHTVYASHWYDCYTGHWYGSVDIGGGVLELANIIP